MEKIISARIIASNMKAKVLGGAKIPHSCSFPVIRKVDGEYKLTFFIQLNNKEQLKNNVIQRPSFWCCCDLKTGEGFKEYNCRESDFCSAPFDKLYKKGEPERIAQQKDVDDLYEMLDEIRMRYYKDDIFDAFAYRNYLTELFKVLPSGQINFYKELSKLI